MTKKTVPIISALLLLVFLIATSSFAGRIQPKPVYGGSDLVFCNRIFQNNYIIITRKPAHPSSPEFTYTLRYNICSKKLCKTVFAKELGQGFESHIVNGPLTQKNTDRINNLRMSTDNDLFIWVEGQASYTYLFHATDSGMRILLSIEDGNRGRYTCQDIDGDGVFEIIDYDTTWHIMDDSTKKWADQMKGHPFAKLIYKFDGHKYVLSEVVPDYEAEKEDEERKPSRK